MLAFRRPTKHTPPSPTPGRDNQGIALFMVVSAIAVLALLVTEFTYVSQVNQRLAYNRLDEINAFYTAKSGLKLALLRLAAYKKVKSLLSQPGNEAFAGMVPGHTLDMIWRFPFVYPIPALDGLSPTQKQSIDKFQKDSAIAGSFTMNIDSESSRFNLNLVLAAFARKLPQKPASTSGSAPPASGGATNPQSQPFNQDAARQTLQMLLERIFQQKMTSDEDFAARWRDSPVMRDLTENIIAWADPQYESRANNNEFAVARKGAPFYHISELNMIPPMEEEIFELIRPALTVNTTYGLNVNTVEDLVLKAVFPEMTDDERKKFFQDRDDPLKGKRFKDDNDFFGYLQSGVAAYGGDAQMQALKKDLAQRQIQIVADETEFKVLIRSQVGRVTKVLEAEVSLSAKDSSSKAPPPVAGTPAGTDPNALSNLFGPSAQQKKMSDLKIKFLRIQ